MEQKMQELIEGALHNEKENFDSNIKFASIQHHRSNEWVRVEDRLPSNIKGTSYSENVFVIEDGEIKVMALCDIKDDDNNWCRVWCNCYGDINGDPEFDDQYNPTLWQPLPTKPQ